jgi:hypothetical protein
MFRPESATRAAFFGVFSIACLTSGAASACNFLENLFGACRPRVVYAPAPEEAAAAPHRRHVAVARNPEDYKQKPLAAPEGAKTGSVAHFSADTTLRKGDIVVTPTGFLVYNGRNYTASSDAFAPVGRKQGEIANLEKASKKTESGWSTAVRSSPKAEPVRQVQRGVDGGAL